MEKKGVFMLRKPYITTHIISNIASFTRLLSEGNIGGLSDEKRHVIH